MLGKVRLGIKWFSLSISEIWDSEFWGLAIFFSASAADTLRSFFDEKNRNFL